MRAERRAGENCAPNTRGGAHRDHLELLGARGAPLGVHDEAIDDERTPLVDLPEGSRPSIREASEVSYKPLDVPEELKGKLDKMTVGSYVLYTTDKPNKKCRVSSF